MRGLKSFAGQLVVPMLAFAYAGYVVWELNDGSFQRVTIVYSTVIAVPLVILGLIIVAGIFSKPARVSTQDGESGTETDEDDTSPTPGGTRRLMWVIGSSFVLVATLDWVGYLVGFFIYVIVVLWAMDMRRPATMVAISVAVTAVVHFVFAGLLGQDLPLGFMTGMMGV
ncbi:MAG: hypothetical protein ACI82H_000133 [Alphaproteobacteria bacterium]|jgi:hypothetical protein